MRSAKTIYQRDMGHSVNKTNSSSFPLSFGERCSEIRFRSLVDHRESKQVPKQRNLKNASNMSCQDERTCWCLTSTAVAYCAQPKCWCSRAFESWIERLARALRSMQMGDSTRGYYTEEGWKTEFNIEATRLLASSSADRRDSDVPPWTLSKGARQRWYHLSPD